MRMALSKFGVLDVPVFLWCCLYWISSVSGQVETPPRVTFPIEAQQIIIYKVKKDHHTINCTADGLKPLTYQWRRNEQLLEETDTFVKAFNNGTLYFPSYSDREDGVYQCWAMNSLGTSLSEKLTLILEREPAVTSVITEDEILETNQGQSVAFKCAETPPTFPEYVKSWYNFPNNTQLTLTNRIGLDSEGNLRFAYVEPSDAKQYRCGLGPRVPHQQDRIQFYNKVGILVKPVDTGITASEPKLQFSSGYGNIKVVLGRTVTLECFFSGYPLSSISWKTSSNLDLTKNIDRFKLEDFNRQLIITKVQEDDQGVFSCTANNGHGVISGYINVNVTSPPIKVPGNVLTSLIRPEFSDETLKCKAKTATSESLNIPDWYRNGQTLRQDSLPDPHRYSFSPDFTQLTIKNLSKDVDTACYQCNVTNSEGYAFYDGFIRVISSIKIVKQPKEFNEITKEEVLDITVLTTGDSCCETYKRWHLYNIPLTPEQLQEPPFLQNQSDVLHFDASSVSEEEFSSKLGQYKCRVYNNHQEVNVTFTISRKAVAAPTAVDAGFQIWWIAIIIAVLALIIIILIIVICVKRNYPGETYQLEKTEIKYHLNPAQELLDQSFQEI